MESKEEVPSQEKSEMSPQYAIMEEKQQVSEDKLVKPLFSNGMYNNPWPSWFEPAPFKAMTKLAIPLISRWNTGT
jgi:hypothetical protein